jgi:hypothetical protein
MRARTAVRDAESGNRALARRSAVGFRQSILVLKRVQAFLNAQGFCRFHHLWLVNLHRDDGSNSGTA